MKKQPKEGQAYSLPKSAAPENATHVAIAKPGGGSGKGGFKYFCRFDTTDIHGQDGVPDDEVKGTYWIVASPLYGSCYNGASLWQGGFDFVSLDAYEG